MWHAKGVTVKHYHRHSDGGVFTAKCFRNDCGDKKQTQSFSGVGAKHKNANAERSVQTLFWMARSFMLHAALQHYRKRGLIIKPTANLLKIDAYPDADFAGMYGVERPDDPACVKSRTGYVINVASVPMLWKLNFKTELSTMEAEATAMAPAQGVASHHGYCCKFH